MADVIQVSGDGPSTVIEVGIPGTRGPVGPEGPQGPIGPSTTFTVGSVTTGAAGSTAHASFSGTSPNQVLDLIIPAGPVGPQGTQGDPGPVGPTGPANTLTIGTVSAGPTTSAAASITGTAPNQVLHLTLPRGEKGDTGDQGPPGAGSPDATTTSKGSIQLAGDLAGTAAAPTVPGLAGKSNVGHVHPISEISATGTRDSTTVLHGDGTWKPSTPGVVDHGNLLGLSDDDHPQYLNQARGDVRYAQSTHDHDTRYYTNAQVDTALAQKQDASTLTETVQDLVSTTLVAGTNITLAYDDTLGKVTITSTTNAETIRDTIATALVAGTGVTITPNDAADTITIASTGGGASTSNLEAIVFHNGTPGGGTRPTGYARVRWVNPVGTTYARPMNMTTGDIWEHD